MIGFIFGVGVGFVATVMIMSLASISKEEPKPKVKLYDKDKITLEECYELKSKGYNVNIDNGSLKSIEEE